MIGLTIALGIIAFAFVGFTVFLIFWVVRLEHDLDNATWALDFVKPRLSDADKKIVQGVLGDIDKGFL